MFRIKNNKLNAAGIEFSLPDRFFVVGSKDYNPEELKFFSDEENCRIEITAAEAEFTSAAASLMNVFENEEFSEATNMLGDNSTGYRWIEPPKKGAVNDLEYACVKYEEKDNYCYEVHFERIENVQLEVLLSTAKKDLNEFEFLLNKKSIKDFYNSFKISGMI